MTERRPPPVPAPRGITPQLLTALCEVLPAGFCLIDSTGCFIEVNDAYCQIYGYTREEILGQPLTLVVPVDEAEDSHAAFVEFLRGDRVHQPPTEWRRRHKDGTHLWTEGQATLLAGEDGQRLVLFTVADITARKATEAALAEESARNRMLFEQSPDGILIIDPQTARFLEFNTAAHRQLGYSRDEFARLGILDVEAEETATETAARIARVIQDGKADFETRQHTRQGDIRTVHVTAQIVDVRGHPVYHCVWRDITARKAAEEALATRTQQLEALRAIGAEITRELDLSTLLRLILQRAVDLVNAKGGTILFWDTATRTLVPQVYSEIFGSLEWQRVPIGQGMVGQVAATRAGLIVNGYRTWTGALSTSLTRTGVTAAMAEPLLYRDTLVGVIDVVHTDPTAIFTDQHAALFRLFADQAAIAIENARLYDASQRELTERKQAEDALKNSEEQARRLAQEDATMAEIGRIVSSTLQIEEVYDSFASTVKQVVSFDRIVISHIDAEQNAVRNLYIAGDGLQDRNVTDVYPLQGSAIAEMVRTRASVLIQADDFQTYRDRFPALVSTFQAGFRSILNVPLFAKGQIIGALLLRARQLNAYTDRDVRLAERIGALIAGAIANSHLYLENARLFAELTDSYARLQSAQEEMVRAEKLRALGQMAAGVAHDLNNMLAAILGQAELLRLQVKLPAVQEALQVLYTAASDGAQVVRRLQEFGRQQPSTPLAPCALAPIVQAALELTRPRWQDEAQHHGRDIQVVTALDGLPPILGHPAELREALTNLILNAVDAMPAGGVLTLAGALDPPAPSLHAPAGVLLTVTDTGIGMPEAVRRHIFDPFYTTKGLRGTGLGLAVVYGILERHGGRIDVTSTPGAGTTFTLRLQAALPDPSGAAPASPGRPVASRRILLIDDEPLVRTTLANLLRAGGHTVVEAESGAAGLTALAAQPVDLVLTDLGMPEMTGWEVAQRVKAAHPHLPVVLLTGWGQQLSDAAPGQAYVDRILAKPIRLEELQATIAALTAAESPARPGA